MIDCLWPNTKKARDKRALNIWSYLIVVAGADLRLDDSPCLVAASLFIYGCRSVNPCLPGVTTGTHAS